MEDDFKEAVDIVFKSYQKILRINLTADTIRVIKAGREESFLNDLTKASDFFSIIATNGTLEDADVDNFVNRTSLDSLRDYFKNNDAEFVIRYRRRFNNEYVWVLLEIQKASSYTEENMDCILFVRDIDRSYLEEIKKTDHLEYISSCDVLTGLFNYNSYLDYCLQYTSNSLKESVGAIFADLNALKVVNDTQGHEAGNDYIKAFARTIRTLLSDGKGYRISGDEFVILYRNVSKDFFMERKDCFVKKVESDKVPVASVGWAWIDEAIFIQDVVKEAEQLMYTYKEKFYGKFPQYKRSALEESTRREFNAIIGCLATSYNVVLIIDLQRDVYSFLKNIEDERTKARSWTEYVNKYCRFIVNPDSVDLFRKTASIDYLTEELKENESLSIEYEMADGRWMNITYRPIDYLNDVPSKVAVFAEYLDKKRINRLNARKKQQYDLHILEVLEVEYTFIVVINSKNQIMKLHRCNGLTKNITPLVENKKYSNAFKQFINTYLVEEDRNLFIEKAGFENVKKFLQNRLFYSFTFRTKPILHNRSENGESQFTYYKSPSDEDIIILAGRDLKA